MNTDKEPQPPTPPASDLCSALADAKSRYAAANPASKDAHLGAAKYMPGGNTRSVLFFDPFPLCFERAEGATLTDLDGHVYVDFLGEYTAGVFGHSNPRILSSLRDVIANGLNFGGHNRHEAKLARLLVERFPALELVRFTNSGTEANLMAIAAARIFTGRDKIMVFSGAYHGGVLTFGSPGRSNVPFDYVIGTYNDIDGGQSLLSSHGSSIAAVMVEPMLQSGGCIPATPAFLKMLQTRTEEFGALLIFDEVVTSRLHPGGIHGKLGLKPDLVTLGKYVGGGMSFGAFGGRADIMEQFDPRTPNFVPHAGTFNNNTLTMAAGYTGMAELFTPEAAIALNERGEKLREELNRLCTQTQACMKFTGMGSVMNAHMTNAEINSAEDAKTGDPQLRELFYFYLLSRGVYLARRGMISLSLAVAEDQISHLVAIVSDFIETYRALLTRRDGSACSMR